MIKSEVKPFPKADYFSTLLFLFFIQQITFLVESIYMLNLLNTQMDIRAGGISFLLLPGLLFTLNHRNATYKGIVAAILICMFLSPLLSTSWRIFSSGVGAGLFLTYLGLQLSDKDYQGVNWGKSAAIATLISIAFRAVGDSLDFSITKSGIFFEWLLIAVAGTLFYFTINEYPSIKRQEEEKIEKSSTASQWLPILGLAGSFVFIYFAFSSPGVIARWTEGNYTLIQFIVAFGILAYTFFQIENQITRQKIKLIMTVWNALFIIFFIWNILLHRVSFPSEQDITPVIVEQAGLLSKIVCYIMLLLSPIVFLNIAFYSKEINSTKPKRLAGPFLGVGALIIGCIFMLIFTNAWGYVGSISSVFRNQFHVPFVLAGFFMMLPIIITTLKYKHAVPSIWKLNGVVAKVIGMGIIIFTFSRNEKIVNGSMPNKGELKLMTYNIQQGVDLFGNKNFEGQLAKIREINPDILCLQESDASRISGGNSDVVRFFSKKLSYYSYYGPKTITGTYGTAILSRFPLHNTRTIFTYSSKDEIGTAFAEISMGGKSITIVNSHPAGNDKAREEHINMVIEESGKYDHVIAMGDYNFNQDSPHYSKVTTVLNDSWLNLYPDAVGRVNTKKLDLSIRDRKTSSGQLLSDGKIDMRSRIDHIFLSDDFDIKEAHYLPAPESETDHPLYWTTVSLID